MAHYSSIKLTEKNRKKLITVPSKWVMGDVLYYPPNKFMEKKLAMELADPTEKWKEIPIEQELLRHRTFEECEDVKSGTEYETDTTSPNKIGLKRKALEDIGNKLHIKSPESTRNVKKLESTLPGGTSSPEAIRLPGLSGACSISHYENYSSFNQQKAPAKKKTVQQSPKIQTSQGSSLKRLKMIHDDSDDEFNGGEYNDGNHDNDGGNDDPIPKSPNSLADNNAMSPTFDLTVTRRLSDRLDSLEKTITDVNKRQGKLMSMMVKIHNMLKFRDDRSNNQDEIPKIESQEDFESVESALCDISTNNELIANIKRFGGSTSGDMVNITLDRIMTNEFQCGVNLCGQNNKIAFESTKLFKVIEAAVKAVFKDADDKSIRRSVGDHLKNAPFRKGGTGKLKK